MYHFLFGGKVTAFTPVMGKNTSSVHAYYDRNKTTVLCRKILHRARSRGSIPSLRTVRKHHLPIEALLVAFADWVGTHAGNRDLHHIRQQMCKLDLLRIRLMDDRGHDPSTPDVYPTPEERRALVFLRQSLRPRV